MLPRWADFVMILLKCFKMTLFEFDFSVLLEKPRWPQTKYLIKWPMAS